ncbi:MAG TPA: RDD family protein [Pyrinomonadaceae bacterium]
MQNYQVEKYQTASRRFWAGSIDGLVFMPLGWLDSWILGSPRPAAILIGWMLISYPCYWLYSVLMHGFYGQTLGKKALGVVVLDLSESPISMKQAFLRDSFFIAINSSALILMIYLTLAGRRQSLPTDPVSFSDPEVILGIASLFWFLVEILTCLTNKKRRAVHDFIAGTVVVNTEHVPLQVMERLQNRKGQIQTEPAP